MYEEISVKREIDWHSLFFRIGLLILIVFIVVLIVLTPKKSSASTPYKSLADEALAAGKEYYTESRLPNTLGNSNSINISYLIENSLLKDKQYVSNGCDLDNSYVKVTKVGSKEYSIYVYLLCNGYKEVVGDSITLSKLNVNKQVKKTLKDSENIIFNEDETINVNVNE